MSSDHVDPGLRERRVIFCQVLHSRRIVRVAMKRLTYNNHTDIQDEPRNARLSYTCIQAHGTGILCVYVCPDPSVGNAAVNPPLRHGREVTRVNEKRGGSPSLWPLRDRGAPPDPARNCGKTFRLVQLDPGFCGRSPGACNCFVMPWIRLIGLLMMDAEEGGV